MDPFDKQIHFTFFPHSPTVHLDIITVLLPTDAQNNFFKRILKFALKQLQHVSVLSPPSGSVLFELAKLRLLKHSIYLHRCG